MSSAHPQPGQGEGDTYCLRPIGLVRNGVPDPQPHGWEAVESELRLDPALAPALEGLAGFSHVIVLFWMHRVPQELRKGGQYHPGGRTDLPLVGVFATRTQLRPNPLGLAVVSLLGVDGPVLRVRGLDATDGTPVLDIKPYLPPYDAPPGVRMPAWVWR
ncbi:MAG: tRNA (N6-threonylcarbamoyladenosine(37)-N6)-methyltransferase TrmO [Chloroflexi bacterium]|nr:tRNA (N6-threonylcarbamoyladenosine(37)-N6)-methyltransferase TrmO [Chloroflexota bacterium]